MSQFKKEHVQDMYFLSPMQEGMLFHYLLEQGQSNAYFEQMSIRVRGTLDIGLFSVSLNRIAQRYDVFRTVFLYEKVKRPVQVVLKERQIQVHFENVTSLPEQERGLFVERFKQEDLGRGFDLSKDMMMRVSVIQTGESEYQIFWSHHHILMDGWCLGIIVGELFQIYASLREQAPNQLERTYPYSDYIKWLERQDKEEARRFWAEALSGYEQLASVPQMTAAVSDNAMRGYKQEELTIRFDEKLTAKLQQLASKHQVTLNTVFQTIWGIVLQRYSHAHDVVFGSVVSGRPSQVVGIEKMVGLFINTIPVRVKSSADQSFSDVLLSVQLGALAAESYTYLPLAEVQAQSVLKSNLFDHILVFENYPVEESVQNGSLESQLGFEATDVSMIEQTSYDLNLLVMPGRELAVRLNYNANVYDTQFLRSIEGHLNTVARTIVEHPEIRLQNLAMVTDEEKQLLLKLNDTREEVPSHLTIHRMFEEQAEKTPEKVAVVFGERQLTYRELNERANRLARTLQGKNVGADQAVGIMVERSPELVVGILAILKAGGAYVPIDPELPEERVGYMLHNSGASILLTQSHLYEKVAFGGEILDISSDYVYDSEGSNLELSCSADNLFYIIYTSGTTGKPKGVMLEHRNMVNLLHHVFRHDKVNYGSTVLQYTTMSFDVCYQEIFSTLCSGGKLYLIDGDTKREVHKLLHLIEEAQIEVLFLPVSFLKFIFNEQEYASGFPSCVRHIITAGEQLVVTNQLRSFLQKNGVYLHNHYGPSETHVVTVFQMEPNGDIPELPSIGRPIANNGIYILNDGLQLQPFGAPGELFIAGDNVGRGYRNNDELTAEKFMQNPFRNGERMYRTGDLARFLPDGNLAFLGRIDHQVKIRGHRIELGEIESQLLNHPSVMAAAVLDRKDAQGGTYLCAYYVSDRPLHSLELRAYLLKELPEYMVPSFFMELDKLPVTPNGKTDRRALPEPDGEFVSGTEYVPPTNVVEEALIAIWQEVLGIARIGIHDNFFSLGGHSLKAMTLMSRLNKHFGVNIPLRELFESPTTEGLARKIREAEEDVRKAIQPAGKKPYYPVSSAQKRMFVLQDLDDAGTGYNMPGVFIIEGGLDRDQFEGAFQRLILRHEALRTSFELIDGEPVQKIHENVDFTVEFSRLSEGAEDLAAENKVIERMVERFMRPFDLQKAPLIRVALVELQERRHLFLYDMHHIISDGVSMSVIVKEFVQLYGGGTLPELSIQYKDYAVWQQAQLESESLRKQEAFWLNSFAGELPQLELPSDFPRPAVQSFEGDHIRFEVDTEMLGSLKRLAAENGSTLYMVLFAAYNVLLSKYSGQEDIVVGTPTAGRSQADLEYVVGMFVGTLALRSRPEGGKTFRTFLSEVKEYALQAFEAQEYPFDSLLDRLNIRRDPGRNPLFDTMFSMQSIDPGLGQEGGTGFWELTFTPHVWQSGITKFDLTLEVREGAGNLEFQLDYSTNLFAMETAERMARHFVCLLENISLVPDQSLAELSMVTDEEAWQIIQEFNDTSSDYPNSETIATLFEKQTVLTPDHPAVVYEDKQLTYRELNERANLLASELRKQGVGAGKVVGLLADRSIELMIGLMGILKAGGAYLLLDLEMPADRIRFMLEDSGAHIVLAQRKLYWMAQVALAEHVIDLDDDALYANSGVNENLLSLGGPRDLAYVIYTSGSTGKPKGVLIEQRSVVRLVKGTNYVQWSEDERILQTGALGFDAVTFEIFGALLNGGTLYLVDKSVILDSDRLGAFIADNRITTMWLTSPLFNQLSQENAELFTGVRQLLVGGDALSPSHINHVRYMCPSLLLINGYGPTENTTFSTTFSIERDYEGSIPIGRPISNSTAYIVNKYNQLQPIGVPGELCVGGDGVARGYANRPELTAEAFVSNPFKEGETMYRTGDLAKWLPDGTIEYRGRIDQQVKIRGYRIELGEIETELMKHPVMKDVVVIAREDANGQKFLCAYIVAEQELGTPEVKAFLAQELPSYMVPAYVVQMERLPLTVNGKIDRRELPEPEGGLGLGTDYAAPRNMAEERLCVIWQDVLGAPQVGIRDDFFQLGGHSLKAMTLLARIKQQLQVNVPLRVLFESPTIEALAQHFAQADRDAYETIKPVEPRDYYPVSSAQKRMFIMSQFTGSGTSYNIPGVMFIEGELDLERFEQTFRRLVARHESLRTTFETAHGEAVQIVHTEVDFQVEYARSTEDGLESIVTEFVQPFNLQKAPLLRVKLVHVSAQRYLLLFDMHHIVSDGVSMGILLNEFACLYHGDDLPELTVHYKDFAVWQNSMLSSESMRIHEAYWLETFSGDIPVLALPTDFPRPAVQSFEGDAVTVRLGQPLHDQIHKIASDYGATLYMMLLAAYQVLLSKYSGQTDVIVGTPVAGRPLAETENILGMFVNTLAIRSQPESGKTFAQFLEEVKRSSLLALEHQHYPLEMLIDQLELRRDLSRNPLFDTVFSVQNQELKASEFAGLSFEPYHRENKIAQFDLSVKAIEDESEIVLHAEYGIHLFNKETIERMMTDYQALLQQVTENPDILLREILLTHYDKLENVLDGAVEFLF
ncbi:amino acid adenylation domain-containing protein [Paenibacillus sp. LMG 31458]|uniref:Amino acid adenylation domain-containing protein n=1 Tax=Paenibacillus phytorum TaxID=2654977 RepID=A0ABX1XTC5_9BACL|nr:non-ribosomal peptide synthetase [Paenibacillus phytorum]NOU71105.1 amino acid adenylation domain-containing protein [Paenibacillus phytorum]